MNVVDGLPRVQISPPAKASPIQENVRLGILVCAGVPVGRPHFGGFAAYLTKMLPITSNTWFEGVTPMMPRSKLTFACHGTVSSCGGVAELFLGKPM
jgi:hypothetical protein